MGPNPPAPSLIDHERRSFDWHHRRWCFLPLRRLPGRRNTRSWRGNDAPAGSVVRAREALRAALDLFLAAGRDRVEGRSRGLLCHRLLNVTKGLTGKSRRRKGTCVSVGTQAIGQLETRDTVNCARAKDRALGLRGEANEA